MLPTPRPSHKQPRLPENEVSEGSWVSAERTEVSERKPSFCETRFSGNLHTGAAREHVPNCRAIVPHRQPTPYSNPPHPLPSPLQRLPEIFSSIESLSETSICHLVHPISIQSKRLPENEAFEESRVFAKLSQTNLTSAQRLQSAGSLEIRQGKSTR